MKNFYRITTQKLITKGHFKICSKQKECFLKKIAKSEFFSEQSENTKTAQVLCHNIENTERKNQKVAAELLEVVKSFASKVQSNTSSDTNTTFGQYVAKRLQEMEPQWRSAKRKAIVLLLEEN